MRHPPLPSLALAALLLAAAPARSTAQTPTSPAATSRKTCGDAWRGLSTDALNHRCLAAAGRLAASRMDGLVLRMDDGTRKVFKDPPDLAEDAFGYALVDFWPDRHIFFVDFAMDDGGISTVVFGKTGLAVDCGTAAPHLAPNGGWLLLESSDPDLPSSFSMIDTSGASAKTVWRSKDDPTTISTHGLAFVGWDGDTKARFRLGNGTDGFVLLERVDDGHWHYDLAGAPPPEPTDTDARPAAGAPPAQPPPAAQPPADAGTPLQLRPGPRE